METVDREAVPREGTARGGGNVKIETMQNRVTAVAIIKGS
jgi:hypothetical protein